MYSKKILEPFAGGFGNNNVAGFSLNSLEATIQAGRIVLIIAKINAIIVVFK